MSTLGQRLRRSREKMGWSQTLVCKKLGISNSTLSGYERDYREPDAEMIAKFAELYEVTTDYLLGHKITKLPELTPKEERDIAKQLEDIINSMDSDTALAFDGEPMDDETKELVRAAIESNLKLTKQIAKKKFTPKKYRKDEE